MGKIKDITGQRFGRLIIKEFIGKGKYRAICDCGNEKIIFANNLRHTKSCGCLAKELLIKRNTIHGYRNTKLYNIWRGIKKRCYLKTSKDYRNYGERGIKMYDEWKNNFQIFYDWSLKNGYKEGLQIDRFPNNNGNYEPSNCRWATPKQQANNKRNNHYLEFNNVKKTVTEWSNDIGIYYTTLLNRLDKGWSVEKTLTTPLKSIK